MPNIEAIVKCLDTYLNNSDKINLTASEANCILETNKLLNNNSNSGKPLRTLLRKGLLPHAFQEGSVWKIPHSKSSTRINNVNITSKPKKQPEVEISFVEIEEYLMTLNNYKKASDIDKIVPDRIGIYAIRIRDINLLEKEFRIDLDNRKHDLMYIGIASKSLRKRFLKQELRAKGHGTFFRSLGAILGYTPDKGSLSTKKNKNNYKFSEQNESDIIKWINANLLVNWVVCETDIDKIETMLIKKHIPLINIEKNPLAHPLVVSKRKNCRDIACSY
jgi:hypothetical protein